MLEPVPVLPVVVPLGVVVFAALVAVLVARRRFSWPRASVAAALAVYAAGIVANTVFPVFLGRPAYDGPRSLPLVLVPFADYELADAVTNVLVFVPLGALVSLLLTRPTWWRVLLVAASMSAAIELAQLLAADLAGGGHIADVNDWLWNAAGGLLGYAAYAAVARLRLTAPLVERFRWRAAAGPAAGRTH